MSERSTRRLLPVLLLLAGIGVAVPLLLSGGPEAKLGAGADDGPPPPVRREMDPFGPGAAGAAAVDGAGADEGPGANPAGPAMISGHVRGDPLPVASGAWISVTGGPRSLRVPIEEDGSFLFPEVPTGRPLDLWLGPDPGGTHVCRVAAGLRLEPGEVRDLDLVAKTVAAIRGRVTDEAGRPLEGVRVAALPPAADWREEVPVAATTGADGRFFVGLSEGVEPIRMRLVVDAVDRGYVLDERLVPPASLEAGSETVVRLRTGKRIAGRVLGPGGRPLPGVRILLLEEYRGDPDLRRPVEGRIETDGEGRFADDAYRPGVYRLYVTGTCEGHPFFLAPPVVTAGDEGVEIRFDGFGSLDVRFEDAVTRRPVAVSRAELQFVWNHTGDAEDWRPWEDGRGETVAFEHVPAGDYRLSVAAPGYVPVLTPFLHVRAGERLGPLRFELAPR